MNFVKFRISYLIFTTCILNFFSQAELKAQSSFPRAGVDSVGNAVVVWEMVDSSGILSVQASKCPSAGSWTTATAVSSSNRYTTPPVLVVDSSNNAVSIWSSLDSSTGNYILYATMLVAGGSGNWTTPVQISSSSTSVQPDYTLVINSNKNIVAAWSAFDASLTQQNVFVSKAKVGAAWSTPVQVSQ